MKKSNKANAKLNGSATQAIRLEFNHPAAKSVSVAGTFNDWRPGVTEMVPVGVGRWLKDLTLPSGVYEYRLVVDGKWMTDPLAKETAPNPFGGLNSVLRVERTAPR